MSKFAQHFEKSPGEYGTVIIEETGFCVPGDAAGIEADCCKRFSLTTLPQAAGVILKALDGTDPELITVKPLTDGLEYTCVKIFGMVNPFAPPDSDCWAGSEGVLQYIIRYQQVGGVT